MVITEEMRKTYEIVKHQYLLEDAQYQVETFLEWNEDYKPYQELKDKVDYEELVRLFEKWQSCESAENDTWQSILYDYFKENAEEFSA